MIAFTLNEIAAVTGGTLHGDDHRVDGAVVTDSREAEPGSLYVARIGEHADGHDFAGSAIEAGAVGVLGSRPLPGIPTVVVSDVQQAFADLARAVVDRAPRLRIVGITGSSGKTSTKDLLAQVLAPVGETVAPVGSYNSEVGVPLTVCRVTGDTRFLVAEMGATNIGNISYLARIAPPSIGIVLNVGTAHVGEFGSVEAIAQTKGELVEALPTTGLAVLNSDDPRVAAMVRRSVARVVTVGRGADAQVRAIDVELDEQDRPSFTITGLDGVPALPVRLGLHGEHQIGNALAVAVAARELGVAPEQIATGLAGARPVSRWRMEVHQLPSGVTLINDAYNANPDSMGAALHALQRMGRGRRTIAVLGEMRELGGLSASAHRDVGMTAAALGTQVVVAVGAGAEPIAAAAESAGVPVERAADVEEAHRIVMQLLAPPDVILFKSSRDSGLRYLGDRITVEQGGFLQEDGPAHA
ncbi:UDP-N-acetylmuramoyl-tripeptide--D-alanyl-D-alanine ligase [Flexivirga endophytica]|uniref:UDP-N-acetylmuramoyl-tripeptide--D-alanyl-D-alanine ligase n=1 Tax=Flexivirga endophytica TaxID=1849103 RepID=A0A916WPT2_9MICO|nr:UDP-N-acetylmuramoyl-tripeptide--D-alanyl-D-alanine ligase [Flexivirga endophytica]GGB18152.1 UDP-N-acetylmuramoyl-tripeptide--D-alanyl-D-alanine ligase [Flexivirga endophytica]GHB37462.1 UDP-N-acetylmuramoyl-tripeptide--D-alanyl-D-alanine ligase [Flexivirga endophytica]